MPGSENTIRAFIVLCLSTVVLGLLAGGSKPATVHAEGPQATPFPQTVSYMPGSGPPLLAANHYTSESLRLVPFAPILPDLSVVPTDEKDAQPISRGENIDAIATVDDDSRVVPLVEAPEGVINIVLLGADKRPQQGDWRTDTIIVVSINPRAESVGMLSIPRDLWIQIPGLGVGRINTVDFLGEWKDVEGGGPALLARTIEANIGMPIHRYVRIDLEGFVKIVDALGGVTIDIDCPVYDAFLDEPLTGEEGLTPLELDVGIHHLDGLTALRYARSRRHGTDFDRAKRQQKLLQSLAEQTLDLQFVAKIPALWKALSDSVDTNLTLFEMVQLATVGLKIKQNRIKNRFIDWRTTENWVTAGGAMVLLPNREKLPAAVEEFLNPPKDDAFIKAEYARVEVQNGTTVEGLAEVAAKRLEHEGIEVVGTRQTAQLAKSTVVVYAEKPRSLKILQDTLHLDPDAIVHSPEPDDGVDFRVVLGSDWQPCP